MGASDITEALRRAQELLKAGKHAEAVAPLAEAVRLAPTNGGLHNDLGIAYLFARRVPEAVASFQRSIALRPANARTHFNLGLALAQGGNFEAALAAHRAAVAIDPGLADAYGRIADILVRKGQRAEAAVAYERAHAAAPESPYGRLCGAKALTMQDRPREAEERLREVLALDPSNSEVHLVLANLLSESGRLDEAAASFERSIELAPWQTTAYSGLVAARRMTEADRPLVARLVARLAAGDLADRQRMMLDFAAGKALEDLGDYERAMQHFDAANLARRRLAPFDRAKLKERNDRIVARYSRAFFASHAGLGRKDETPLLVLGMPRSGTTLLERILSSHPRVGGGGELVFWDAQGPAWNDAEIGALAGAADRLRGDYLRLLRGIAPDALRVTDKMPFNFFWVGLVHLLLPDARIVHARRSPIDTCVSIYTTYFSKDWGFASDRGDLVYYYREYARLMDHWRSVLPADRFLEVDYEAATADPEGTARRLVGFAGLEWDDACLAPERNPDAVRTANKWEARQPIYRSSVERWRRYEPWIGELRGLLP